MTNQILLNNVAGTIVQNNVDPNNPHSSNVANSNISNQNINNSHVSQPSQPNINTNNNTAINNNEPSFILTDNSQGVQNPSFGQTSTNRITNTGETVTYNDGNKNSIIQPLSPA